MEGIKDDPFISKMQEIVISCFNFKFLCLFCLFFKYRRGKNYNLELERRPGIFNKKATGVTHKSLHKYFEIGVPGDGGKS